MQDDLLDQLRDLVNNPTYHQQDLSIVHVRAMALISRLKALNRTANAATRQAKEKTAHARQDMDHSHLGLQNLLYEKRHLEREIEKCRHFASIYQDVPLYTLDDFVRLAPEDARTHAVLADDHQLMLNRLSFELAERQRLDKKKKDLLQEKEDLLKESKTKTSTLESVKNQIESLMKTASEIQKKVDQLVLPASTTADVATSS